MPYILVDNTPDIFWGGLERIEFDPANPEEPTTTCLLETGSGYLEQYNVRSEWNNPELSIEYCREDNQHLFDERPELPEANITWGVHVLTIEHGANNGNSVWQAKKKGVVPGPGWRLEAISGGRTNRRRSTIWAIQRGQQGQFRRWLLAMDKHCALTGETCESALEAAHIVPAHQGGCEVPSNGILLRADIHRLFDSDPPKFEFCSRTGEVLTEAEYDSFDLSSARICNDVLKRIAVALDERREMQPR